MSQSKEQKILELLHYLTYSTMLVCDVRNTSLSGKHTHRNTQTNKQTNTQAYKHTITDDTNVTDNNVTDN